MQPAQIQPPISVPTHPPVHYAGFWRRFAAYLIDHILLGVVSFLMFIPALAFLGIGIGTSMTEEDIGTGAGFILAFVAAYVAAILFILIARWIYYALMESSNLQGTLGKMALGIKVTDLQGNRVTFGRATGRYFGRILSSLILEIGFIMAGFTEKKQALHDIIAGCLVVMK